jgi:peptide/nickel transport system substrate-binding protein
MRTHPIGTGPFKFAEFKPNEYIRGVRNPDYWKPGRPYVDGVEWTIIPNRSTQTLAFIAGKFAMSFPYEVTLQAIRDIQNQAPDTLCELTQTPVAMNLLLTRDAPPFDDPDIRRAMQLTIDHKSFIDTIAEGQGDINGAMQSPPAGLWRLPPEILATLPDYGPDVAANRAEARKLMEKHGYGPDHRLAVKVATRNIAQYRDPAIILTRYRTDASRRGRRTSAPAHAKLNPVIGKCCSGGRRREGERSASSPRYRKSGPHRRTEASLRARPSRISRNVTAK